jgi:transcriptional regulator with XRE-family HTH domain
MAKAKPPKSLTRIQQIGRRIQELRMAKGWTAEELSVESGIPSSTLRKYEHGWIGLSLETAEGLAKTLGVGVGELLEKPSKDFEAPARGRRPGKQGEES